MHVAEVCDPISDALEIMAPTRADYKFNLSGKNIMEQTDVTNHTITQGIASSLTLPQPALQIENRTLILWRDRAWGIPINQDA